MALLTHSIECQEWNRELLENHLDVRVHYEMLHSKQKSLNGAMFKDVLRTHISNNIDDIKTQI